MPTGVFAHLFDEAKDKMDKRTVIGYEDEDDEESDDEYDDDDHADSSLSGSATSNNETQSKKRFFLKNCRHIQSLTLSDTTSLRNLSTLSSSPQLTCQGGLKNLVHLAVQLSPFPRARFYLSGTVNELKFYRMVGAVLSQNPGVQELEWKAGKTVMEQEFIDLILKRVTGNLKKLTISGGVGLHKLGILAYLIQTNQKRLRQIRKQQLQLTAIHDQESYWKSYMNHTEEEEEEEEDADDNNNDLGGCSALEELALHNGSLYHYRSAHEGLQLTWLHEFPGVLPIRALTFLDYDTDRFYRDADDDEDDDDDDIPINTSNQSPNGSLLAILSKCPNLERLCFNFDISRSARSSFYSDSDDEDGEKSSRSFLDTLSSHPHHSDSPSSPRRIPEREDFVDQMYKSCPNLREIEFGMGYQFTTKHWTQMMQKYGQQLESLSIWGNVLQFDSTAFMAMVGPPTPMPARPTLTPPLTPLLAPLPGKPLVRPHCLTRLNINGMRHLDDCAWIVFRQMPSLKEFKARDVPLDAMDLIVKDGWVCKGLEILEIMVLIPKHSYYRAGQMMDMDIDNDNWSDDDDDLSDKDDKDTEIDRESNDDSDMFESDDSSDDDDDDDDDSSVRMAAIKRRRRPMQPLARKKAKTNDSAAKPTQEKEDGTTTTTTTNTAKTRRGRGSKPLKFSECIQVRVCEMIGDLTRLRELRLEGKRKYTAHKREWGCLELTLETGLNRLGRLENLEKLNVSMLQEKLRGRREMEWIARNWVHRHNRQWLRLNPSTSSLMLLGLLPSFSSSSPSSSSLSSSSPWPSLPSSSGRADIGHGRANEYYYPEPKFKELIGISTRDNSQENDAACFNIVWLRERCPGLDVRAV
ncbi:hypothetical protein BGX31_010347 [Mortierella sp. GBA43]|nr:hypothetical protein BGX31_010347 [Mortierella sp. GBA43]